MKLTFGEKVKYARDRAGITSEELANKLGVRQPFISKIENNKKMPSSKRMGQLANILNVPVDYFYSENIHIIPDEEFPPEYREEASKYVNFYEAIDEAIDAGMSPDELREYIAIVKGIKNKNK
jgi:transcriptional regulator with XRE-family HTH domain